MLPDANVPTSIRSADVPVVHGSASDLGPILDSRLAGHADGIACCSTRSAEKGDGLAAWVQAVGQGGHGRETLVTIAHSNAVASIEE